nr:DNA helicase RecQ [Saprospiraceae bacterium]
MELSPLKILKDVYGYYRFRDRQEEIISAILNGRDAVVLMPTGGGKSICFQIPALCKPGFAVVFSPLIALMKDQVDALRLSGVQARYLNSTQTQSEQMEVVRELNEGKIKLLYLAPERVNDRFWDFLAPHKVSLFAIDEAHCISHWGHDFRPDYRILGEIKNQFPHVPIAAFTATADKKTREDILSNLNLHQPKIFVSSFNRPNIRYIIEDKKNSFSKLLDFLEGQTDESGIIYCLSRKSTEGLAVDLRNHGFKAMHYHAGLNQEKRGQVQDLFAKDEIKIIVATIAFGMGINKSNVRFVVHMDLPKNIESYYQETGRAGRDGLESTALLFYSYADVIKLKRFVEIDDNPEQSEIMLQKLDDLSKMCNFRVCRRKFILNYFDEKANDYCGNCDFCLNEFTEQEATIQAQMALSAVVRLRERFGISYVIDFLRGSASQKIKPFHREIPTFGVGEKWSQNQWYQVVKSLIQQNYLARDGGKYPVLKLTEKSGDILRGREKFYFYIKKEKVLTAVEDKPGELPFEKDLFERLRVLRKKLADEEGVPPFVVFSDKTLRDLATFQPQNLEEMLNISGFGQVKLQKYGRHFLDEVTSYTELHGKSSPTPLRKKVTSSQRKSTSPSDTLLETKRLIKAGLNTEEIAAERGLAESTVEKHLAYWLAQKEAPLDQFVNPEVIELIKNACQTHDILKLKPLKDYLGAKVSYRDLKFYRARSKGIAG